MSDGPGSAVVVIDDDTGVREALCRLFRSVGLVTHAFGSVRDFLATDPPDQPGCIVLDIRLPGKSGLEYIETLPNGRHPLPIVLISAHVDVPMAVRAMKAGALDVLTKPVREQDLLDAVNRAIEYSRENRDQAENADRIEALFAQLTERERQIMALVVEGKLNKQIAGELSLAEATIKLHRGHVMRKMGASSVPQLVRMADQLRLRGGE